MTLGVACIQVDALFWKRGWVEAGDDEFLSRVAEAAAGDAWVVDGNVPEQVAARLWVRADTVVWLDLPLLVLLWRLIRRTISRTARRAELWEGNRDRLSHLWKYYLPQAIMTYRECRAQYERAMIDPRWAGIEFVAQPWAAPVRCLATLLV